MDIVKKRKRTGVRIFSLLLAAVLTASVLPAPARAATSAEIQKEIDALEKKNNAIQAEINAIQRQYDANFDDMEAMVAQKNAIDQEMTLINDKIETTNAQIAASANLKLTSLYDLAVACGIPDGESFVQHFIDYEREVARNEG